MLKKKNHNDDVTMAVNENWIFKQITEKSPT